MERCIDIVEVMGSNPVRALIFFQALFLLLLKKPFPVGLIVCGLIVCTTCGSIHTSIMIKGVLSTSL